MKENRNYYKKKIYLALLIITFILGFVSLYEYYRMTIHNPFRLLSTVLYGVIKLFLFTPPIATDDKTSFLYEIAKWLAPILTSTFIFTKISNTLLHIKNIWFNKISANHILVFENSVMGETLINNLIDEKNSYKISLISKHFIDDNLKSKYEKKGVATYQIDFEKSDKNEIREFLNTVNINNVKYMFFCSDMDLENYALYINVIKRIKPQRHIGCYIKCESNTVSSYIEDMIVYEREKKENLKKIDTTHFNQTDLIVRKIMCESLVNESISKSMDSLSSMGDIISAEQIDENIKRMHIVLIGINELTDTLLKFIANDMTTKLTEDTLISIMDYDAYTKIEKLFAGKRNYLNKKFEEFKELEEIMKTDNEKFGTEFCKFLKANPILDFLSSLEHKRWCNSYYTMNFVYGEKRMRT